MQTFIDTTLQTEFDDPAWGANWSTASDQAMRSRISTTQTIDSSVSANEPSFRKLTKAYTMLSDLGTQNLNQAAFQVVIDSALATIGEAINDLAGVGARLGTAQEQTSGASSRLRVQADLITQQITAMEEVDPDGGVGPGDHPEQPARDVAGADRPHPAAQHPQLSLIGSVMKQPAVH